MLSLYDASIPSLIMFLGRLKLVCKKGEEYCVQTKTDEKAMLSSRLHPNMLPLSFQIQMCSNTAKLLALRVGGLKSETLEDNEQTFEQFYVRLDKTIAILKSVEPTSMDGDDSRKIHVKTPIADFTLGPADYITMYAMPNFHFHMTTAYAIFRSQGVILSKLDYLSSPRG